MKKGDNHPCDTCTSLTPDHQGQVWRTPAWFAKQTTGGVREYR